MAQREVYLMNKLSLPREIDVGGRAVSLRLMRRGDAEAVVAFARAVEPHDLLFLQRDIRNRKVVAAWIEQIERGQITSVLALHDGRIGGCSAVVRDDLSWSSHVSEIRVVTAADMRGSGLGRLLAQESLLLAESLDAAKVFVRTTVDQVGALAVFQDLGFKPEALLREHVRDAEDRRHDIAILALDLERQRARHENFGFEQLS
jgi:N-acetylglutamate synthase-like GNAT family acetyltransferase